MSKLPKGLRVLSLLLCLPLTGCLDVAQELWIYEDGGGRMKTVLGLHDEVLLAQGRNSDDPACEQFFASKQVLEQREGVESVEYKTYKEGGVLYCVADITVSNFTQLASLQDDSLVESEFATAKDNYQTEFSLKSLTAGYGAFRQHIRNQTSDPGRDKLLAQAEQFTNVLTARLLAGHYWSVTLHAPKITEANGERSEDETTVSWRVPLYDLLNDEQYAFDIQASFEVNVPWYKELWDTIKSGFG